MSGSDLTVTLDGRQVTHAENLTASTGFIGFQGETGVVEYRSIRIRELH
ncbi:MAG: DUF1080 domain-containing protein [Betaproteobacteria bacterium]|nr:MAG: DUF1080 domain-containing protein [Betaproteobacteria bacterium]